MKFDSDAWDFAATVLQSEGDAACQRFLLARLSPECLNGIAREITKVPWRARTDTGRDQASVERGRCDL